MKKLIIADLGVDAERISDGCLEIVRWACSMVAGRAAALAACAIAAIVLHTGNDKSPEGENDTGVDVGMDGRYVISREDGLIAVLWNSCPTLRNGCGKR